MDLVTMVRGNAVAAIEISKVYNSALSNTRPGIPRDNLHFCLQSAFTFEGKKPCLQKERKKDKGDCNVSYDHETFGKQFSSG